MTWCPKRAPSISSPFFVLENLVVGQCTGMTSADRPDPSRPLREVLDEKQVEFLREHGGEAQLDQLLDKSLREILDSENEPDLGQLLDRL